MVEKYNMKTVILSLLFVVTPVVLMSQEQTEDLSFKSGMFGYDYYIDVQKVSFDTFMDKLNDSNVTAGGMFKSGRNLSITGTVIGSVGAFCFGFDLGTRLGGGDGNTALLIGGSGVMVGGIIMYYVGEGKMKKALTLYKNNLTVLYVSPTQTGIGLCLNF